MTVNCKGCGYLKGKCTYDGKCQNKQIMEECYQQGRADAIDESMVAMSELAVKWFQQGFIALGEVAIVTEELKERNNE